MMKPPEQMTDEELRIEIAEFCGLDEHEIYGICQTCQGNDSKSSCPDCDLDGYDGHLICSNYPQDLNAMWEAEEKLDGHNRKFYISNLYYWQLGFSWAPNDMQLCMFKTTHATAKQRAIAFVKTIREIQEK
jgi:hypothetical protein